MRVLFLSARFPYPPLRGDQVRAYHQLRLLGPKHQVTLLSFTDGDVSREAHQAVARYCESIVTVPLRRRPMAVALVRHTFSHLPFQSAIYQTPEMAAALHRLLHQRFDLVHIQLARMAPFLEAEQDIPRVIDLIDALSLNMKRRYLRDRSPLKWISYLEWQRLSRYEQLICHRFNQVTVVSAVDQQVIGAFPNLSVNANGIDLDRFPFTPHGRKPDTIVFTGNMGYFPNVNAVVWFAQQVLPSIRERIPQIKFYVVGARPSRTVQQLAKQDPAIIVTGYVENIVPYLTQATVAVAPIQAGSGIQNKVIEAMATGTPLVVTSHATSGIEAIDGTHLLMADEADHFAEQVICLLQDQNLGRGLAGRARCLVEENYTWEHSVSTLEAIYNSACQEHF